MEQKREEAKTRLKWRGFLVTMGGIFVHMTLGSIYTFGNLTPYLTSFLRKKTGEVDIRYDDSIWIYALTVMGQGCGMLIGGFLERKLGPRLATLTGCWTMSAGVLLTYWTVHKSFLAVLSTYGFLNGIGTGIAYGIPIVNAMKWNNSKRGVTSGAVVSGFAGGGFIFNQVVTAFLNPKNEAPTEDTNGEKYFDKADLLDRVPKVFLLLGGCYAGIQLIGVIFIQKPLEKKKESITTVSMKVAIEEKTRQHLYKSRRSLELRRFHDVDKEEVAHDEQGSVDGSATSERSSVVGAAPASSGRAPTTDGGESSGESEVGDQDPAAGCATPAPSETSEPAPSETSEPAPGHHATPRRYRGSTLPDSSDGSLPHRIRFDEGVAGGRRPSAAERLYLEFRRLSRRLSVSELIFRNIFKRSRSRKERLVKPLKLFKTTTFYKLWFIFMLNGQGIAFILTLWKTYGQTFIEDDHFLSLVGAVSSLFNAMGRITWGIVADRYTFRISMMCLSTVFAVFIFTVNATELVSKYLFMVWICIINFGFAGNFALLPFSSSRAVAHICVGAGGAVFSAMTVSSAIGAVLTVELRDKIGWHGMFFLSGGFSIISAIIAFTFHAKTPSGEKV